MSSRIVIGFCGLSGSGKSESCKMLLEGKDVRFTEYAMAGKIKKILELLEFEPEGLYGTQEQKMKLDPFWKVSGRFALQKMGTEVFRDYIPTLIPSMKGIWSRIFCKFALENPTLNIVISDVRFQDEVDAIHSLGGRVVLLERQGTSIPKSKEESKHSSETGVSSIVPDFHLKNDGSLDDLRKGIESIVVSMMKTEVVGEKSPDQSTQELHTAPTTIEE